MDGGVSAGVLGLSGIIAKKHHLPTLGFIPFGGLDSIGPRNHMIVCGATYPDREKAVAAAADILVCWGGKKGTIGECLAAIENDSIVILPIFREYNRDSLPGQYLEIPRLAKAKQDGQLLVCTSYEQIPECVAKALKSHAYASQWNRKPRRWLLKQFLKSN